MTLTELVALTIESLDHQMNCSVSIRLIRQTGESVFVFVAAIKREGVHAIQTNSGDVYCWKIETEPPSYETEV